jgi:hypothetical protein
MMNLGIELSNHRPDGPSWSLYLMVGAFVLVVAFFVITSIKRRK